MRSIVPNPTAETACLEFAAVSDATCPAADRRQAQI